MLVHVVAYVLPINVCTHQSSVPINDVARVAAVSIKTVSRVVNREENVADGTRQRVTEAIKRLGYRPNALVQGLASGRSRMLAILIPRISDTFDANFVQGAERVASAQGFRFILCHIGTDPKREQSALLELASRRVDGFIFCSTRMTGPAFQRVATAHPVVAVMDQPPEGRFRLAHSGESGRSDNDQTPDQSGTPGHWLALSRLGRGAEIPAHRLRTGNGPHWRRAQS